MRKSWYEVLDKQGNPQEVQKALKEQSVVRLMLNKEIKKRMDNPKQIQHPNAHSGQVEINIESAEEKDASKEEEISQPKEWLVQDDLREP